MPRPAFIVLLTHGAPLALRYFLSSLSSETPARRSWESRNVE